MLTAERDYSKGDLKQEGNGFVLDSASSPSVRWGLRRGMRSSAPMGIELTATPGASVASTHATERDKEERIDMHMATHTKQWTLEELHSLPDDGNKYELVRGELFVTPPPTDEHETVLARLSRILDPYVAAHGLGMVYHPRAVMRFEGSEVEPDLMVRQPHPNPREGWDTAPTPCLIVEVLSGSTRRRDHVQKRQLYLAAGVPEYWIVDTERAEVRVVRAGVDDDVASGQLVWAPAGAAEALLLNLESVFG